MYSHQRGVLSILVWILGCFLTISPIYGLSVMLPDVVAEANLQPTLQTRLFSFGNFFLLWLPYFAFFLFLASFCFRLFPSLAITKDGLSCEYIPGVLVDFIKWDEIQKISIRDDYVFLIIFRRGLPLFNGLYFNAMYGRALKIGSPILVLSPYLTNRDEILAKIREKSAL